MQYQIRGSKKSFTVYRLSGRWHHKSLVAHTESLAECVKVIERMQVLDRQAIVEEWVANENTS